MPLFLILLMFVNNPINTEELPRFEALEFKSLKRSYRTLINIQWTVFLLVPLAAIFLVHYKEDEFDNKMLFISLGVLALLYVLRLVINFMGFKRKGYLLREHDILFRTGLIMHKVTAIPYNRIQHSEIREGFLSRMFSIAKLKVFTAGGAASDLSINGLSPDEAQQIKDYLSKTVSAHE